MESTTLWQRLLAVFVVSIVPVVVGLKSGIAGDCYPGQHDGQCGLATFVGLVNGLGVGALVLVCGAIAVILQWHRAKSGRRSRVRKRRTARVMLFDEAGLILLVRFVVPRADGEFVFWALPGGEIEAGETEAEAAVREVREELGLELAVAGPVYCDKNEFLHQGEMQDTQC